MCTNPDTNININIYLTGKSASFENFENHLEVVIFIKSFIINPESNRVRQGQSGSYGGRMTSTPTENCLKFSVLLI